MKVNCSYIDPVDSSWVPACIEFCLGTIGNILALVILWISRRQDGWRPFDTMFAGLALENLLSIVLAYPFIFKRYASDFTWCYSQTLCDFNSFLLVNNHLLSAFLICAMSIDQFLIVNHVGETGSSERRNGKRYKIIVVVLLAASASISLLHVTGLGSSRLFYPGTWCYLDFISQTTTERDMSYVVVSIGTLLILLIILFNVLSFWKFYKNPYLRSSARYNQTGRNQYCSNMNVFMMTISVVFIVLWTPFLILMIVAESDPRGMKLLEVWLLRTVALNAVIDPWLYTFLRRESLSTIAKYLGHIHERHGYTELDSTRR